MARRIISFSNHKRIIYFSQRDGERERERRVPQRPGGEETASGVEEVILMFSFVIIIAASGECVFQGRRTRIKVKEGR